MQTCIEKVRKQLSPPIPGASQKKLSNRVIKTKKSNLYYANFHMECYYFCQQYKDHFKIIGTKGHKRVLFAALFF